MAGSVKCAKVEFGTGGTYPSPATVHATVDGSGNLVLTDVANSGGLTLTELAEGIGVHAIDGEYHTGVDGDFATQYYNITRLKAFLNDSGNADEIGIASDVGGNVLLSTHVADATIHGGPAKFTFEVAKDGKPYTTIQSAIDAVPTTGPDAASATQRYVILIYPGVYAEAVLLNKSFVSLVGVGTSDEIIVSASTSPTVLASALTYVENIKINQASGTALSVTSDGTLTATNCYISGAGVGAGIGIENAGAVTLNSRCTVYGELYGIRGTAGTVTGWTSFITGAGAYAIYSNACAVTLYYCRLYGTTSGFGLVDATAVAYECINAADYFVSGATGNTSSAITIAPTLQTVQVSPGSAGTVTVTANTHTDSATITWPSQNDGLSVGYGANGVDATGALSGIDSHFIRRAAGSGAQKSAGSVVCIEEKSDGFAANETHNLYLIRSGQAADDSGEFIRAYDDVTSAVVFQLTRAGDIINAGDLTVGGDAIINADASGATDSCTMTLRTTDSDGIVVDYKLYASHDLQTHAVNGVGCFVGGTTVYAPFAASTFYGSGAGLSGLPITGMPPGGSWPALTSDLVVGPLTVNSAADGSDYKSVEISAPTSGTNRYTLELGAPSGGTINRSLQAAGDVYSATALYAGVSVFKTVANSIIIGEAAGAAIGASNGQYNTICGAYAGNAINHSGATDNVLYGSNAGRVITQGSYNVGVGGTSLRHVTTGNYNVALGRNAMGTSSSYSTKTGSYNICIGYNADTGANNLVNAIAIGKNAVVSASNACVIGGTGADAISVAIHGQTFETDNASGLILKSSTASAPVTLTPGSGAKVETAAQLKAAGFEAGVAAGITTTFVDNDGNTITVTGGIITAITPP